MPFTPANVPSQSRAKNGHEMTFRVIIERGQPRLHVSVKESLLAQVSGKPKYWRLDLDESAGLGRLTGCIQDDGNAATRSGCGGGPKAASRRFSWLASELLHLFPTLDRAAPLAGVRVDSMGIVFKLPSPPKTP